MSSSTENKPVWLFREGKKELKDLLGGKGANLAEMTNIGLPVPPGFTVTTEVCTDYYANGKQIPAGLMDEVKKAVADVENAIGKKFGDNQNPLLFSVRSGAKFSLPGMMDTVLNLGLNDAAIEGLISASGGNDALRLRFVSPLYHDVFGHHAQSRLSRTCPKKASSSMLTEHKETLGKDRRHRTDRRRLESAVRHLQSVLQRANGPRISRPTLTSSLKLPSPPFSVRGTTSAPSFIATKRRSRTRLAPPSTCRRWSSATWAKIPVRALCSRATPRPART